MNRQEYNSLVESIDWGRTADVNREDLRPGVLYPELFAQRLRYVLSEMETVVAGTNGRALRVVDIGCYPGVFGKLAKKHFAERISLDGVGIGLSPEFRESMSGVYDNFYTAELDPENPRAYTNISNRTEAASGSYDFIVAAEIIEHLYSPLHFLDECARLLCPSGVLVVTTPNVSYIGNICRLLLGHSIYEKLEKSHIYHHSDWRPHMRIYDRHEIARLCACKGLKREKALLVSHGEERFAASSFVRLKTFIMKAAFIFPRFRNQYVGVFRKES